MSSTNTETLLKAFHTSLFTENVFICTMGHFCCDRCDSMQTPEVQ